MAKFKVFWQNNRSKILLFLGIILVATLSFQAGYLKGKAIAEVPMVIEVAANREDPSLAENLSPDRENPATTARTDQNKGSGSTTSAQTNDCRFVGSKNSDKYHLPGCQWAKRIKPDNLVCFASEEDTAKKGYLPDKNCIK